MITLGSTALPPAECHARLLEMKAESETQGRFAEAVIIGAFARCVFRRNRQGLIVQRPPSQIKRELRVQARALQCWSNEPAPIREIGLAAARRLNAAADGIADTGAGKSQGVTGNPARFLLNELGPFFAERLAAAGHEKEAAEVLAKGLPGRSNFVGESTDGWRMFEEFITTQAPRNGVNVSRAELRTARRDYLRSVRRKAQS